MGEFFEQLREPIWLYIVVVIEEIAILKKSDNAIKTYSLNLFLLDLLINLLQHQFFISPKVLDLFLVFLLLNFLFLIEDIVVILNQVFIVLEPRFCGRLPFRNLQLWFFKPIFSRYFLFRHNTMRRKCILSLLWVFALIHEVLYFLVFFLLMVMNIIPEF